MTSPTDDAHSRHPLTDAQRIRNLQDALIEDILAASDEEIMAECVEDGIDPEAVAKRFHIASARLEQPYQCGVCESAWEILEQARQCCPGKTERGE